MGSSRVFAPFLRSEELHNVSESEYDEVMQAIAEESTGFEGYGEWSEELQQGSIINTPHGEILINKECSHATCHTTRCAKGQTYRGIAI
jgi:hypothetical protein